MTSTFTAFVVDDEEPVRRAFDVLLRTQGINARSFSSAEEFLGSYRDDWQGCLFADVRMPNMSGVELCRELRKRNSPLHVVLMTGRESPDAFQEYFDKKIAVLEKPFSAEQALAAMRGDSSR